MSSSEKKPTGLKQPKAQAELQGNRSHDHKRTPSGGFTSARTNSPISGYDLNTNRLSELRGTRDSTQTTSESASFRHSLEF